MANDSSRTRWVYVPERNELGVDATHNCGVNGADRAPIYPDWARFEFSDADSRVVDEAAKRLAAAAGFGACWGADHPGLSAPAAAYADAGEAVMDSSAAFWVERRTKAYIGRKCDVALGVPRLRKWATVQGVVARPTRRPSQEVYAAAGSVWASGITGPLRPILFAFALESWEHWLQVEPFLARECGRRDDFGLIAGRDAMARIMYRVAGTSLQDRARQLGVRKESYVRATRASELTLREWIIRASAAFLQASTGLRSPL